MALSVNEIEPLICQIDRLGQPTSSRYGRLVSWQSFPNPVWHYGVGLSDTHIFDTGRILRPVEHPWAQPVTGVDDIAVAPDQAIARLKMSLTVFADWDYNLIAWNCEHYSRLITTDRPRCYQSRFLWWLANLTPEGDHKTAQRLLSRSLQND
ncbi:hypothetical protein L3556_15355 [Candidatus Synechococcus calcipolaris G9]|uniref:LRAT domain-containing protein n=1 Tax=Candidatus Synechococcus calcipolaris G9 TaxID=1497997 RepID=A0ABT6F361_9SYNE|nr:hypothetical protein [Candidatus Synechococcus calcipolaris]MDG2992295.1 hypothetical protein [Candidatus Synechococcus calcipolaris G9]